MRFFRSNRANFERKNAAFIDMAMGRMAMGIEVAIKVTAGTPVSNTKASGNKRGGGGHMKSQVRHFKSNSGKWRVESPAEYSAVQEAGRRAGSRPFTHYTTPGTSAGWFKRAINQTNRNKHQYIEESRKAVGL